MRDALTDSSKYGSIPRVTKIFLKKNRKLRNFLSQYSLFNCKADCLLLKTVKDEAWNLLLRSNFLIFLFEIFKSKFFWIYFLKNSRKLRNILSSGGFVLKLPNKTFQRTENQFKKIDDSSLINQTDSLKPPDSTMLKHHTHHKILNFKNKNLNCLMLLQLPSPKSHKYITLKRIIFHLTNKNENWIVVLFEPFFKWILHFTESKAFHFMLVLLSEMNKKTKKFSYWWNFLFFLLILKLKWKVDGCKIMAECPL